MIDKNFLTELGIDEEKHSAILDKYSSDIKAEQDKAAAVQTQLDDTAKKLDAFGGKSAEEIAQEISDWKQKYEQAEAARKAKAYEDGVKAYVAKQGMKNDIYAKHLTEQITSKGLQFDENGVLLGGDDVVKALRESCPDAFQPDKNERAVVPGTGGAPKEMNGVESAFYAMNPHIKHS